MTGFEYKFLTYVLYDYSEWKRTSNNNSSIYDLILADKEISDFEAQGWSMIDWKLTDKNMVVLLSRTK